MIMGKIVAFKILPKNITNFTARIGEKSKKLCEKFASIMLTQGIFWRQYYKFVITVWLQYTSTCPNIYRCSNAHKKFARSKTTTKILHFKSVSLNPHNCNKLHSLSSASSNCSLAKHFKIFFSWIKIFSLCSQNCFLNKDWA